MAEAAQGVHWPFRDHNIAKYPMQVDEPVVDLISGRRC